MAQSAEFDSFLGGSENLPDFVNLSEFIKHRLEEVVMLTEAVKESPFRGQAFQRLPKHMRRRQMSHYIKRLPRRLQKPYLMSLKDGPPSPTKRPSRKFRRRPGNLLLEYNRRQKKSVWLETHIWHAKRFHMTTKWGYRLPERPVNKNFKACYRAMSEHCLLFDHSYYNCIELKGSEKKILDGLKQCTSSECGLGFAAKMYLNGTREGSCTLFHPNSYPHRAIGNVTFMWQPVEGEERRIWIWVHPLTHNEVVDCFSKLFELDLNREKQTNEKKAKGLEEIKLEPKNVPFARTPKYSNKDNSVTMTLLKDTLNRFQLTGALSQALVSQAFSIAAVDGDDSKTSEVKCKKRKLDETTDVEVLERKWWEKYYDEKQKKNWKAQKEFYCKLSEFSKPEDMPSGMILSLVIEDPRLTVPSKREKAVPKISNSGQMSLTAVDSRLSQGPIWVAEIRDEVSLSKLTNHEINEARSKKIVPGFGVADVIPDKKQSRIPILLVQKPGRSCGKLGFGSGWDIITPAGFGMPVWFSLIFRGARTGGLRESDLLLLELNSLKGFLQPDSTAGESHSQVELEHLRQRYFRLPPNKRPNFAKLGILSPFCCPWNILIKDWSQKTDAETDKHFCVLRNEKILRELAEIVSRFSKNRQLSFSKFSCAGSQFLVPVIMECTERAKPNDLAAICIPHDTDFRDLKSGPFEPSHVDENEHERKTLRSSHRILLKSLKRKRQKDRSKLKEDFANNLPNKLKWKDILRSNTCPSESHVKDYKTKMEALWLPDVSKVDRVVDFCSRTVIGYVTKGGFSFSKAHGLGLGYVTLPGLMELLAVCQRNKSKVLVLFRKRNEVQYKFAKLSIALE